MLRNPGLRKSVEQPVLDLNFAASQIGSNGAPDGRMNDFNRGSNAWFVDSDGLVKKSPHNLITQSEAIDSSPWFVTSGITITANSITAPDGTLTADKLEKTAASFKAVISGFTGEGVSDYAVSFFVKEGTLDEATVLLTSDSATTLNARIAFNLTSETTTDYGSANLKSASITDVGDGWYRCTVEATFANQTSPRVYIYPGVHSESTAGFVYIWGAQVSQHTTLPVGNPYLKTEGSAVYAARLDHDPVTNTPKGLLIEEARTNLVDDSEDFSSSQFNSSKVTITADSSIAPDGTNTASEVVPNTDTAAHLIRWDDSVVSGTTYTASVFAKQASGDANIRLLFNTQNSGFVFSAANFDLSAGTVTNISCDSASIEDYGNGWFRCSVTETATASVTGRIQLNVLDSSDNNSYAGDGTTGVFIWGWQIEAGSFPTSYIQTTGTTLTRNADVATMGPTTGGTELVTNGTYDTDTTGWTAANSTLSVVSNRLRVTSDGGSVGGAPPQANQTLSLVVGRRYRVTADVNFGTSANAVVQINANSGGAFTTSQTLTSSGSVSLDFTAQVTDGKVIVHLQSVPTASGEYQEFDNVSVRELYPFEQYRPDQGTMVVAFDTQETNSRGPWWFSRGGASSTGWGLRLQSTTTIDSMVRDSSNFNTMANPTITPAFDIVAASYEQRASDTFCSVATADSFADDGHINDIDVSVDTLDIGNCEIGGSNTGIMSGHIKRLQYFPIAMNDETKLKNMCDD